MSKGLETLKDIKSKPFSWEKLKDSLDTIEKELKALEIIKAHTMYLENVNCFVFTDMSNNDIEILKKVLL